LFSEAGEQSLEIALLSAADSVPVSFDGS
jgi:hypothetical protein